MSDENRAILGQIFGREGIPSLSLHSGSKPRSYQQRSLAALWEGFVTQGEPEQLCIMPPCSGKTAVAFALVSRSTSRGATTLFLVNSKEEMEHLIQAHEGHDQLSEEPYLILSKPADILTMIDRLEETRIFYATRQSLAKHIGVCEGVQVDFLVVDGAHSVLTDTGAELLRILERKATLYLDNHLAKLPSPCKPHLSVHVTHRELIQHHGFPSYTLKTLQPQHDPRNNTGSLEVEGLVLTFLLDLVEAIQARCGQGLVFFDTIEACEKCADLFRARSNHLIVITHSQQPMKVRRASRTTFAEGKAILLFAVRMALAGVTFPAATDVILLTEGCSALDLTRMVGRVFYPFPNKTHVNIWDCADILSRVPIFRKRRASLSESLAVPIEAMRGHATDTFQPKRRKTREAALERSKSPPRSQQYRVTTTHELEIRSLELSHLANKHMRAQLFSLFQKKVFAVGVFEFLLNNEKYRKSDTKVRIQFGQSKILYDLSFGQVVEIASRFIGVEAMLREVLDREIGAAMTQQYQGPEENTKHGALFVDEYLDGVHNPPALKASQRDGKADAILSDAKTLTREIEDVSLLKPLQISASFRFFLETNSSLDALQELVSTNPGRLLKLEWWTRQDPEVFDLTWRCDLRLITIAGALNINNAGVYNKPRNAEDAIVLAAKQALVYLGVYSSPTPSLFSNSRAEEPCNTDGEVEAFLLRHAGMIRRLMKRCEYDTVLSRERYTFGEMVITRMKTEAGDRSISAPRSSLELSELDASFRLLCYLGRISEVLVSEAAHLSPRETILDTGIDDPMGDLEQAQVGLRAPACLGNLRLSKLRLEFFSPTEGAVVGLNMAAWDAWIGEVQLRVFTMNDSSPYANEEAAQIALFDLVSESYPEVLKFDYRVCLEASDANAHIDATLKHFKDMITARSFVFQHQEQWGILHVMNFETTDPISTEPLRIARVCWSPDKGVAIEGCGADLFAAILQHTAPG